MQVFLIIIIVSLIVQFLTERIKTPIPENARKWAVPLVALTFGELICILGEIDLFGACGIALNPLLISYILTGICVSGGSTLVNELIKAIVDLRNHDGGSRK